MKESNGHKNVMALKSRGSITLNMNRNGKYQNFLKLHSWWAAEESSAA